MPLPNCHESAASYGTMESALAEISKLMAVQSPQEVVLIGIGSPGQVGSEKGYALTPHERRVLKLLVEGHNYKTAALEIGVSVNTVSFHVRRVYEKLQVHSKSEAVAKALKNHLV